MTLALYGKSRKRKGGLAIAGLLAVAGAIGAAMLFVSVAFAHHNTYTASATCEGWKAEANYVGGDSRRLLLIQDVKINGQAYDTSWSTDADDSTPFGNDPIAAGAPAASEFWDNSPSGSSVYSWDDTDGGFSIFKKDPGVGALDLSVGSWTGSLSLYQRDTRWVWIGPEWWRWGFVTKWTRVDNVPITAPAAPENCTGNLIIHKVNQGGPDGDQFTADITGGAQNIPFSESTPSTAQQLNAGPYTVTEDPVSGYQYLGWALATNVGATAPQWVCPGGPGEGQTGNASVTIAAGQETHLCFYNRPEGSIKVIKIDKTISADSTRPAGGWDFNVPGGTKNIALGGGEVVASNVPAGDHTVTEVQARSKESCPALPNTGQEGYYTTVQAPADYTIDTPGEQLVWTFTNEPCPATLAAPTLEVRKVIDFNGNGIKDGADYLADGWDVTVSCMHTAPLNGTTGQNGTGVVFFPGTSGGTCTVSETTKPGYNATVKHTAVDSGVPSGPANGSSVNVSQNVNDQNIVTFFNQPLVDVKVRKIEQLLAGSQPGQGWTMTISGCGFADSHPTGGADGTYTWEDLPVCNYAVSENPNSKPGFIPGGPTTQQVNATTAGETYEVTFTNLKEANIPLCTVGCEPPPPPPPPTAEKPKPTETVAGEKTPGPTAVPPTQPAGSKATPIAPSAGSGLAGGGTTTNLLLAVAGLVIISGGLSLMAIGQRKRS